MSLGHECNLGDHRKKMLMLELVQMISKVFSTSMILWICLRCFLHTVQHKNTKPIPVNRWTVLVNYVLVYFQL